MDKSRKAEFLFSNPHPSLSMVLIGLLDSFTVTLQSPDDRLMPAIGAVQGDCQWLWWMVDIPTGHVHP